MYYLQRIPWSDLKRKNSKKKSNFPKGFVLLWGKEERIKAMPD